MKCNRILMFLILLVFSILGLMLGRAYIESRVLYERGKESLERGDWSMAIAFWGRGGQWYFPGNPYVRRSLEGLWNAARMAEEDGENELALKACYTLRGSLYGTKGLFMAHQAWLEPCNQKIADLTMIEDPGMSREDILKSLRRRVGPRVGWALLVILGFWGWVGSMLGFISFSFDSSGRLTGEKPAFWGSIALGTFLIWIFSMLRA